MDQPMAGMKTPLQIAEELCSVQPMDGALDPLLTWFKENPGMSFSFRAKYEPCIERIVMPDGRILNRNTDYTPSEDAPSLHKLTPSDIR
jgi:hypothetical protein